MTTLTHLPFDVLETIFNLLDHKSLLAMREVCKITKKMAELTVMKNPLIGRLKLSQENRGEIGIEFFPDRLVRVIGLSSKLFMVSAVNYLPGFSFNLKEERLFTSMPSTEITSFFHQFTLFTRGFSCNALEISHLTSEIVNIVSNIFEGKTVSTLAFKLDRSVESRYRETEIVRIIGELHSTSLHLHFQAEHEDRLPDFRLVCGLAGIVDSMTISGHFSVWEEITSFADIIFSKGCSYLDVSEAFTSDLSFQDAFAICSNLHALIGRKQFYFAGPTSERRIGKKTNLYGHVIEVVKKVDKNVIEVRQGMSRAQW